MSFYSFARALEQKTDEALYDCDECEGVGSTEGGATCVMCNGEGVVDDDE